MADNQDYDAMNLGSIAGVMLATFLITEFLKKIITPKTWVLNKIPAIALPVIVACTLALILNKVAKLDNGSPVLSGNTWVIFIRAMLAAITSLGINGVIQQGGTSLGDSTPLSNQPTPPKKK